MPQGHPNASDSWNRDCVNHRKGPLKVFLLVLWEVGMFFEWTAQQGALG